MINEEELKNIRKNEKKQLSFFDDFDLDCDNSTDNSSDGILKGGTGGVKNNQHIKNVMPGRDSQDSKDKLKKLQSTLLSLKSKYGSNILIKGTSLEEGATGIERNGQVGGHKA